MSKWAVSRGEQEPLINLEMYCSKLIKPEAGGEMGGAFFFFFFFFPVFIHRYFLSLPIQLHW